jgi:hypothetical protein
MGDTWEEAGARIGIPGTAAKRRFQRIQRRMHARAAEGAGRSRAGGARA